MRKRGGERRLWTARLRLAYLLAMDGRENEQGLAAREDLSARLARSHRSVLAGLQRRLAQAEARLQAKEADAGTHHSALKRERLHVAELRQAEEKMRGVVEREC